MHTKYYTNMEIAFQKSLKLESHDTALILEGVRIVAAFRAKFCSLIYCSFVGISVGLGEARSDYPEVRIVLCDGRGKGESQRMKGQFCGNVDRRCFFYTSLTFPSTIVISRQSVCVAEFCSVFSSMLVHERITSILPRFPL